MANTDSRIAPSSEAASDDFASPVHPQPPVAAKPAGRASPGGPGAEGGGPAEPPDRFAFDPVPLRYREDGLTPEKQRAYVEALADCGIAREAAARVGLSEQAINRVRRRDDARSFDNACEAAHIFGARRIRSVAWERAIEGTLKGRYYRGELVAEERVHDNRLLTYLYGKVAHLFEPTRESRLICDRWEDHMDALEQGPPPEPKASRAADPDETEWTGLECREDEDGIWWTSFPPPAGFDGHEQGEFGEAGYERTLSPREQALIDCELDELDAENRAAQAARRDRYFGFAGDEVSSLQEAETHGTSEPSDPDPRPIEYKSAFPPKPGPCPMLAAAMRVHAEARRRGGTSRFIRDRPLPPAPAANILRPASPEEPRNRDLLRASAPPRESARIRRFAPPHPNARPPASLEMNHRET